LRKITICEDLGEKKVPGSDHSRKTSDYRMVPGTAWKTDDATGTHSVVEVSKEICAKAKHTWCSRFVDGRTVIMFSYEGQEYCQPATEDERAREVRLGSTRKVRKLKAPRRQAPGVAEAAAGEPEPERRQRKVRSLEDAAPAKRRGRSGPRGGMTLED
jgi:hypothetical protein